MRFLYKQEVVSYEDLLVATQEAETEWTKNKSAPVQRRSTTLKEEVGLKDLRKEIEDLTATPKSATFQGVKPKKGRATMEKQVQKNKNLDKTKINPKTKGPQPSAARPFSPTERPIQCFKCGSWGHGWRNCLTQGNINWRELMRVSQARPIGSDFLCETDKWHNPDPLYQLIGEANESKILIENREHKALIDSGAQVSSISKTAVEKLGFLQTLLELEGAHGGEVPYLGYTELQLQIPGVTDFTQDVLMLVVPDTNYNSMVPVTIGTLHIDMILESATKVELDKLSKQWKCTWGCILESGIPTDEDK